MGCFYYKGAIETSWSKLSKYLITWHLKIIIVYEKCGAYGYLFDFEIDNLFK